MAEQWVIEVLRGAACYRLSLDVESVDHGVMARDLACMVFLAAVGGVS